MRQWDDAWCIVAPCLYRLSDVRLGAPFQVPIEGVASHQQGELEFRHRRKKLVLPGYSALPARRQVAALRIGARKTKGHADNGNAAFVIERLTADTHPLAQAITRRIVEGNSRLMDAKPRRLSHNAELGGGAGVDDGARIQIRRTDPAGADIGQEALEFGCFAVFQTPPCGSVAAED